MALRPAPQPIPWVRHREERQCAVRGKQFRRPHPVASLRTAHVAVASMPVDALT